MRYYIKDGLVKPSNQIIIEIDGMVIINPSKDRILDNGWLEYDEETIYERDSIEKNLLQEEVITLKQELKDADYKIIKCIEAFLCQEELPYDILELHRLRNEKRDKINQIEGEA
jgi:hypothetical protein